jgi:hypothetical protein
VRAEEVLSYIPVCPRTLVTLRQLEKDPLPSVKVGATVLFDLDEVAEWWQRWKKRPKSEQEVLNVGRKKTRQRGRLAVLPGG